MTAFADRRTVLLVDDEKDIRDVLAITLGDSGYDVLTAENGHNAMDVYRAQQPPIVLTDIKMPGMDGIELLRKIKHENPETEVIMITGHGDMDLAIESLKHQATDFITKPINVDALEISLQRAREKILIRRQLRQYTENLEKLVKEKSELQDRLSSLGLMIGSISHSIKGLLTGLDGGMYLLQSGLAKKNFKQSDEGWQIVTQMVERIRKMILDILFYAKERDLNIEPVALRPFVEEVAQVIATRASDQGIDFACKVEPSAGMLEMDAGFVHAALVNILENAVDACVKDHAKTAHHITFSVKTEPDDVIFTIADNGCGMDAEAREKIFTLFFSTKGQKGTGLGLFIANNVIKQHGGVIQVESELRKGTRFIVRIPKSIDDDG